MKLHIFWKSVVLLFVTSIFDWDMRWRLLPWRR